MAKEYNKETHSFEVKDNVVWHKDIEKLAGELVDEFDWIKKQNDMLREENQKLKEGIWEKEEVARLKSDYEKMRADYYRGFAITEEEEEKINKFKDNYKTQKFGAIGGAFKYEFVPTSIGTSGTIIGPDGKKLIFCEFS